MIPTGVPPPAPAAVVVVSGIAADRENIRLIAVRSGVHHENVERAFANGRPWVIGGGTTGFAARVAGIGERLGWPVRILATSAQTPTFLPAMVMGGVAQSPLWFSTGLPLVDTAVAAGLGVTALASIVRQSRRIGPARDATLAHASWAELHRAPRVERPTDVLFRVEAALSLPAVPANVRADGNEALSEAWFVVLRGGDSPESSEASSRAIAAAETLRTALNGDERAIYSAVKALGSVSGGGGAGQSRSPAQNP